MVQTESRVWSDSGVEPAVGDEVYTGKERPIAEYDNWAMWAVTKDVDTIAGILNSLEKVEAVTRLTFDTEANRPAEADLTLADDEGWIYLELDTGRIYSVKDDGAGTPVWFQLGLGENDVGSSELATDAVGTTHLQTDAVGESELDGTYPDGSVGLADLGFDTATQTELNNHASPSDAHHTYPVSSGGIQANAVTDSELDASIAPTWTGSHTFDAGLSMGGSLDLAGNQLTDSQQGYYDLTDGSNLRLATGKTIEDGSGTARFIINSSSDTIVCNGAGNDAFYTNDSKVGSRVYARSGEPFQLRDEEGSFNAVEYITSSTTGALKLTNAHLDLTTNRLQQSGLSANRKNRIVGSYFSNSRYGTNMINQVTEGVDDTGARIYTPDQTSSRSNSLVVVSATCPATNDRFTDVVMYGTSARVVQSGGSGTSRNYYDDTSRLAVEINEGGDQYDVSVIGLESRVHDGNTH